jgi:hypothetical protein
VKRRHLLTAGVAAALATDVAGGAQRRRTGRANGVTELESPAGQLAAFMKLQTRLTAGRVWYWYRCRLDYAIPDRPIGNLCGYDSLYRFDVQPPAPGSADFTVTRWETSIYTDAATDAPIDLLLDPVDGRRLEPFHFTEGPVAFTHGPRRRDGSPFSLRWNSVGDDVWVSLDTFWDFPHPLPPKDWPLASSGERLRFSNSSTLRGSLAELADPRRASATCRLSYQATSGWLPWMQRGATPGHVIWRGQGIKLDSPAAIPRSSRNAFERIHPEIFRDPPWSGKRVMFEEYAKRRTS